LAEPDPAPKHRAQARWRRLSDGHHLLRGAGFGFAAIVLIQGTLIAERFFGEGAGVGRGLAPPEVFAEPAAGPDSPEASAAAGQPVALEPPGRQAGCDPRLLRAIEERSRQLDARSSDLADRARMLEVIEARAAEQVQALEAQRRALQSTLGGVEESAEAEIERLVKIYESMNPKEAARIFDAMPVEVAAGFMRRMSESKSALVMARLEAERAYAITLAIANNPEPLGRP
jgi:flagellar motility protein MotE (MotC chaperone)